MKEIQRYASFLFTISRSLHANITKREVTDIIMLNRRLLIAALEIMELKKNVTNLVNLMTVAEMQERYPALNWTEYIRAKTFGQINITDYDTLVVNVMELGYFDTLMDILKNSDPEIISLYQTLHIIIDHMERVNKSLRNLKLRMSNPGPQAKFLPRWKTCVDDIVEDFGVGISYVYVQDFGSESLKNFSVDIITRLKEQFERMMAKSQWFDEATYDKAKEKLDAVMNQIAYSDELLSDTFVESHYKGLDFGNMSYFDSILQLRKLGHIRNVENYLDPSEFSNQLQFVEVTMVNGFYIPFSNSIQIPMGILQSKFIDLEGPLFLNYGSLGFTMAHELSHAFDDFGRQFDLKGNVANWYTEKATALNAEKEQCIIDQFNGFSEPETELKVSGCQIFLVSLHKSHPLFPDQRPEHVVGEHGGLGRDLDLVLCLQDGTGSPRTRPVTVARPQLHDRSTVLVGVRHYLVQCVSPVEAAQYHRVRFPCTCPIPHQRCFAECGGVCTGL